MILENKEFFAQNVHKYIVYKDIEATLDKYKKRIINELSLRGHNSEFFKNKIVIDIGTGFQAIIASQLGAKFVYHLDISQEQILWMENYCHTNNIDNIKSMQCDVTNEIFIDDKVDIVLVFGIWHHLINPNKFMKNLIPIMNLEGSDIWLRIYRSGSWSRWLVSNLRSMVSNLDTGILENMLEIRYPSDIYNQWKGDLLDDLMSPIWQAFHPNQFKINGISSFIDNEFWEYNFDEKDENFRVDFSIRYNNIEQFKEFLFPNEGVEQTEFQFKNKYKNAIVIQDLFQKWQDKNEHQNIIANKVITIYELVRKKAIYDIYSESNCNDYCKPNKIDAKERLAKLLMLLKLFVEDK